MSNEIEKKDFQRVRITGDLVDELKVYEHDLEGLTIKVVKPETKLDKAINFLYQCWRFVASVVFLVFIFLAYIKPLFSNFLMGV